ncbi:carbamate kinase, partial [candidate division WOR-3 bacterium]|nr:carbamate kinase [candidate division WOR-3 bacterium]
QGLKGVAAVIDKDLASSLLAGEIGAERLVISTAVEQVYLDYGQANQTALGRVSAREVKDYLAAGQFPDGSMGPKIEAALDFLQRGGKEVVITDPEHLGAAMSGKAGTHVVP